jgi:hypothetical protein
MSKPQVIVVTGSREWEDRGEIFSALKPYRFGSILIHGGCRGADTICGQAGIKLGFKVWELPYFEDEEGIEARNASMVAVASAMQSLRHPVIGEAFPLPGAIGTWKCVRLLRAAGIKVNEPKDRL